MIKRIIEIFKSNITPRESIVENINFKELNKHLLELNCFHSNDMLYVTNIKTQVGLINKEPWEKLFSSILEETIKTNQIFPISCIESIRKSRTLSYNIIYKTVMEFGSNVVKTKGFDLNRIKKDFDNTVFSKPVELEEYKWNKKVEWNNNGYSHRMAQYIYDEIINCKATSINANITKISINKHVFNELFSKYEVFLLENSTAKEIFNKLYKRYNLGTIYRRIISNKYASGIEIRKNLNSENIILVFRKNNQTSNCKELQRLLKMAEEDKNDNFIVNVKEFIEKRI